jgi:hypothetical protein
MFLRRTKKEIFRCVSSELSERPLEWNELPLKTDIVVWIPLSNVQKRIYSWITSNKLLKKSVVNLDKKHIFVVILALK